MKLSITLNSLYFLNTATVEWLETKTESLGAWSGSPPARLASLPVAFVSGDAVQSLGLVTGCSLNASPTLRNLARRHWQRKSETGSSLRRRRKCRLSSSDTSPHGFPCARPRGGGAPGDGRLWIGAWPFLVGSFFLSPAK